MVSRVSASVITVGVYQVARRGYPSAYLCHYCRCISGRKVWLVVSASAITSGVYQVARFG